METAGFWHEVSDGSNRLHHAAKPVSQDYEIARRCLRIESHDHSLARSVTRYLSDFHFTPLPDAPRLAGCTLRLRREAVLPAIPSAAPRSAIAHGWRYATAERLYLAVNESLIIVESHPKNVVEVWVGAAARAVSSEMLPSVYAYAVKAALRRCGAFDLHAAGLVEPEGALGVCLVGESGSGKSTLAVQLADNGWQYLSDDALLLSDSGDEVSAHALRRDFSVGADALELAHWQRARHARTLPLRDGRNKWWVEPHVAFPNAFAAECRPRLLIFTQIADSPRTIFEPLSQTETMMELLKFCPWSYHDPFTAPHHLRLLSRLVKQTVGYVLHAGRNLLYEPRLAHEEILARLSAVS